MVGGLAAGVGGDEGDAGTAEAAAGRCDLLEPGAGVPGVVEAVFEAVEARAQDVTGGAVDDAGAGALEEVEEAGEELGDGFVFAGLAGEDEQESRMFSMTARRGASW